METSDIINDSFKYPLSDFKKFLTLGIPYLIIGIFTLILTYESTGLTTLSDVSEEAMLSSPIFSTFLITALVFFIVLIVCTIIMNGIGISVIRETIKASDMLPNIELKTNIIDGIKSLIVSLVYILVPLIIFFIIFGLIAAALGENSGIILFLLIILFFIAMIIIGILLTVAICRLAETNSIGEALNFSNILDIAKKIGLLKIFATLLICNILLGVISLVGSFIGIIPVIGIIIVTYLLYTYTILVTYRAYGLLYRDKDGEVYSQKSFQQPYTPIENNQVENVNNQMNNYNPDNDENLDFQNTNVENNNQVNENPENLMKKCSTCGYSNPDYVKICVNCGNEL